MVMAFYAVLAFFFGISIGAFAEHFFEKKRREQSDERCKRYEENVDDLLLTIIESIRDIEDRVIKIEEDLSEDDSDETLTLQIPASWIGKNGR